MTERYELTDRITRDDSRVFCTGIQALARLPVEQLRVDRAAGLDTAAFASGYPGSPLGGLDREFERAARLAPELPIVVRPGLNEELAASAVMGSQLAATRPDRRYDGVVGLWYGKAPGFDRACDALRHAVFTGTSPHGGAVAIVGDDPGAKSSTLPSSSDATMIDLHIPILYPADVAEALELGRHAIALSRASGLWVGLKIVAAVADGTATITLDPDRVRPVMPTIDGGAYECRPDAMLLSAHSLEIEQQLRGIRTAMAVAYGSVNGLNRVTVRSPDAWLGVVASGFTYLELMDAFHRLGLDERALADAGIRVLRMQMPIPFDPEVVRDFAAGLEELMVVEEMNPSLERWVRDALYGTPDQPAVTGKSDREGRPLMPESGPLVADRIVGPLRAALAERLGDRLAPEPPEQPERIRIEVHDRRTPAFCSGCPHNRSTRVPPGTLVGAGIGCHTMALLSEDPRLGEIVGITAMGSEGAEWIGMSEFVETTHFTQNLGDGTYFHSGQLAIQAAVDAGVNVTFKLLWNGYVAMTGGHRPPGQRNLADVCRVLLAQGVARIIVTTDDPGRDRGGPLPSGVAVWDRTRIIEAQHALAAVPGVTVMVHDQPCAAELRRIRRRDPTRDPGIRVLIDERVCEGCGDCAERSSCLSVQPVQTVLGPRTRIDQATCNLDMSCLEGDCPSFVTVRPRRSPLRILRRSEGERVRRPGRHRGLVFPPALADPDRPQGGPTRIRLAGVGGTGVVTASQVVATAAMLDGFDVRGLDQTGLSQKAGPVVSDLLLDVPGHEAGGNLLGEGQADGLLAFDTLAAAADGCLGAARPDRTALVGSTSFTPTVTMVLHPDRGIDDPDTVRRRVESACLPQSSWVDAEAVAERLAGSPAVANLVVVGMAVQSGVLPVSPESVRSAIELNGVAVESNLAAFEWGRVRVHDPEAFEKALARALAPRERLQPEPGPRPTPGVVAALAGLEAAGAGEDLLAVCAVRAGELTGHSGEALAVEYLEAVLRTLEAEEAACPGSRALSDAVALHWYRLAAYKDEYEVARLLTAPGSLSRAVALIDGPAEVRWHLRPPLLRSLGMDRKIALGTWAAPVLRALTRARGLRGHWYDPFGHTRVRRAERRVAERYRAAVDELIAGLAKAPGDRVLEAAVEVARLPEVVRGYEDRKLAGIAAFEEGLEFGLERFGSAARGESVSPL